MAGAVGHDGVHVQLHDLGGEGLAVGKAHVPAQMEGVDRAVGRDLPAFREPRPDPFAGVDDQRLEDHALGRHLAAVEVRMDVAYILGAGIDQLAAPGGVRIRAVVRLFVRFAACRDQGQDENDEQGGQMAHALSS